VTDDDLFKMLSNAEEMSLENWRVYRALYNAELGKLADHIEQLEAALRDIIVHCEVPAPPNAEALKMFARKALEKKDDEGEKRND